MDTVKAADVCKMNPKKFDKFLQLYLSFRKLTSQCTMYQPCTLNILAGTVQKVATNAEVSKWIP